MARKRHLSPALFRSEHLLDAEAHVPKLRLAWAALWTVCDREGRFVWKPRVLRADAMPLDVDVDFAAVLAVLVELRCVVRYEVDGRPYGYIPREAWRKFQSPHPNESPSVLPAPPDVVDHPGGSPLDVAASAMPSKPPMPSKPSIPTGASAPRARKPVTEQDGLIGDLSRMWSEAHSTPDAPKPIPEWGGEAARACELSKKHGEEEVKRRFRIWLACRCKPSPGHPLSTFVGSWGFNHCVAPCESAPKRDVEGERRRSLGRPVEPSGPPLPAPVDRPFSRRWVAILRAMPKEIARDLPVSLESSDEGDRIVVVTRHPGDVRRFEEQRRAINTAASAAGVRVEFITHAGVAP